jgi:hypothetical protein
MRDHPEYRFLEHPASYRKSSGRKPSWRRIAQNVPDAISPLPVGTIANRPPSRTMT